MLPVIVAVVSVVGGVLAGLLPSVVISARRRLLGHLRAEQAAIDASTDPVVREHLVAAQRSTSRRYRVMAGRSATDAVSRNFQTGMLLYALVSIPTLVVVMVLQATGEYEDEVPQFRVILVLVVIMVVTVFILVRRTGADDSATSELERTADDDGGDSGDSETRS